MTPNETDSEAFFILATLKELTELSNGHLDYSHAYHYYKSLITDADYFNFIESIAWI